MEVETFSECFSSHLKISFKVFNIELFTKEDPNTENCTGRAPTSRKIQNDTNTQGSKQEVVKRD